MGSDFRSIPVIDVSGLFSPDPAARGRTARRIGRAARDVGFLYIVGHGLDERLFDGLLATARDYFARPMEAKLANHIGRSSNHSGYVPEGEEVFYGGKIDRKESYDVNLDAPHLAGVAPLLGPTQWPDDAAFKAAVSGYYAAVAALARRLFGAFAIALGLEESFFEPYLTAPPSQLRRIHYPFDPSTAADSEGIGAHSDYECFTILRGTTPGLEVMNGDGRWIDAPPLPGAFVVNIGDMLEAWSNGVFVATSHRVRRVGEERYAFPFFAACDYFTEVEPLASLVGADRPAAYGRIVAGEHLFAQTARTFAYLKRRQEAGDLALPSGDVSMTARPAFGQLARAALR
jgi:isopenicillin N synthase-like dioxygenase